MQCMTIKKEEVFVINLLFQIFEFSIVNYQFPILLSLLSDSNQRPRDYKSRALAN